MNDHTAKTTAEWPGIEEAAGLLNFRIGAWHDFGYVTPPTPDCQGIPPLGERSAEAIKAGHGAIKVIDEIVRDLYGLREQLVGELRADEDIRAVRVDAMLAEGRARREAEAASAGPRCGSPATCSEFGHEHPHIDDAVQASGLPEPEDDRSGTKFGDYLDEPEPEPVRRPHQSMDDRKRDPGGCFGPPQATAEAELEAGQ
jgi:hypothetical protein